jgi:non-heme chloroperoxidase
MTTFKTRDDTEIFYKDWGAGRPVVFSHGWPLNSDAWESQMRHMADNGFRAIAHDRRGHGRSTQTFGGNDMHTYADDLVQLIEHLDLHDAVLVGHSTGGGEAALVAARLGTARVRGVVLVSAVAPTMVQGLDNPEGVPLAVLDSLRASVLKDRSQLFKDFAPTFYGADLPGAAVSQGMKDTFWAQGMMAGLTAVHDCIKAFSETDFSDALRLLSMPVLVIHGDADHVVPFAATGKRSAAIAPHATLKVYSGAPHAVPDVCREQLNADLLTFVTAA